MRWLIRGFFRTLRWVLSPFMILGDMLTSPRGMVRTPKVQQTVDEACKSLKLYQFRSCPFCIKVRREMKRLSLAVPLCDALHDLECRQSLQQGGGQIKVPCLRITEEDGSEQWMYESEEIKAYLRGRFAQVAQG